jgi:hypothetical protein
MPNSFKRVTHGFWCPQPDGQAAIFPMADFLIVTKKKTMAASRKNPARG